MYFHVISEESITNNMKPMVYFVYVDYIRAIPYQSYLQTYDII